MNTPITEQIMKLHEECKSKMATAANEHVLRESIARLERDRARLLEYVKALADGTAKGWPGPVLASLEIKDKP